MPPAALIMGWVTLASCLNPTQQGDPHTGVLTVLGFIVAIIIVLPGLCAISLVFVGAIKEGGLTLWESRDEELIVAVGRSLAYIVFAWVVLAAIALALVTTVRTIG